MSDRDLREFWKRVDAERGVIRPLWVRILESEPVAWAFAVLIPASFLTGMAFFFYACVTRMSN